MALSLCATQHSREKIELGFQFSPLSFQAFCVRGVPGAMGSDELAPFKEERAGISRVGMLQEGVRVGKVFLKLLRRDAFQVCLDRLSGGRAMCVS